MSDNNNEQQIGVKINSGLWSEFRDDVQRRHGAIRGHLKHEVENALREYINASEGGDTHDRLTNIEEELAALRGEIAEIDETKKRSGLSKTVENRLDAIKEEIHEESDGAPRVHEQVIEMAIKKHAGQSKPTLRQYKKLLRDEDAAFEDPRPGNSYYFRSAPQFCAGVNQMYQDGEIEKTTYLELVEGEFTRDWWGEQVDRFENGSEDTTPGFQ